MVTEIYEPSQYIKTWNDVFDVPSETNLTFSKGSKPLTYCQVFTTPLKLSLA
jgi:hypothetical protein